MAYQFEVAHHTPFRTRLRWSGDAEPAAPILQTIASDPSVKNVDFRPATGSLIVVHGSDFGVDRLTKAVRPLGVAVREKPLDSVVAKRATGASNRPAGKRSKPADSPAGSADFGSGTVARWSPIVAEVEAVVLFGLILGWIRDWFAGRSLTLSTVILLLATGVALVVFWLSRRRKAEEAAPELEFIYA